MEAARLSLVPPPEFDGEFTVENFGRLIEEHRQLRLLLQRAEDRLKGADLEIARLRADEDEKAESNPYRGQADVLVACWKAACKRRRDPSAEEILKACARLKKRGLAQCLRAIAGAAYDPTRRERRNGTVERFDDFELLYRSDAKMASFADRAPIGWEPNAAKVAAVAGLDVEQVERWLK